jgi:hypothetical protein
VVVAVPGLSLDVTAVGVAVLDAGPAGSPVQPASARASTAQAVVPSQRVRRGRGVANSTRRRYGTAQGTYECRATDRVVLR